MRRSTVYLGHYFALFLTLMIMASCSSSGRKGPHHPVNDLTLDEAQQSFAILSKELNQKALAQNFSLAVAPVAKGEILKFPQTKPTRHALALSSKKRYLIDLENRKIDSVRDLDSLLTQSQAAPPHFDQAMTMKETLPDIEPLKPLKTLMDDGVSFEQNGLEISWYRWHFRYSVDEVYGPRLYSGRFDDRSVFYQLALVSILIESAQDKDARDVMSWPSQFKLASLKKDEDIPNYAQTTSLFRIEDSNVVEVQNVMAIYERQTQKAWRGSQGIRKMRELVITSELKEGDLSFQILYILGEDGSIKSELRNSGNFSNHLNSITAIWYNDLDIGSYKQNDFKQIPVGFPANSSKDFVWGLTSKEGNKEITSSYIVRPYQGGGIYSNDEMFKVWANPYQFEEKIEKAYHRYEFNNKEQSEDLVVYALQKAVVIDRAENKPISNAQVMGVEFLPYNFFSKNPTLIRAKEEESFRATGKRRTEGPQDYDR